MTPTADGAGDVEAVEVIVDTADAPFAYDHGQAIVVEARTTVGYLTLRLPRADALGWAAQLVAAVVVAGEHERPCRRIEDTVPVDRSRVEELAGVVGVMEDWLLHADTDTHRDLAGFLAGLGNMNRNPVGQLVDELGTHHIALRRAASH